jgi:hypothetical protein
MVIRKPGQIVRASDTEVLWARKGSDESVTSSATLQNDDSLVVQLEALAAYEFTVVLAWTGNVTGDIKFAFTFPSGGSCYWTASGPSDGDAGYGSTGASRYTANWGSASGTSTSFSGSTSTLGMIIQGVVVTSSTAGNLQLQWAQATSNGTATVVKAGSFISATRRE